MKVTRFVPLLAVAALGVAACGSDDSSDSATTDAAAPADTAEVAAPAGTTPEATSPAETPPTETTPAGTDAEAPSDAAGLQLLDTDLGSVLGDAEGFTVYLFMPDAQGDSTCYDECEANWPFVAEVSEVGEGLDASLLGTTERTTGESQATYNGWPLYSFGGDSGPGETSGQGVGDVWYAIDATGTAIDND